MREYIVKITDDGDVYVNGKKCCYSSYMDTDKTIDADKKALLSLANTMGYEAPYLFEEMVDRLDEMLDD